ncbi:MAG: lysophospholipase [Rhizobacter sp.]
MDHTLTTSDGLSLHLQAWPTPSARGTVLLVHGLGEHAGRYAHVAAHLNRDGWNVVGYDHRGHGRSDGAKGRLNTADDMLRDLGLVVGALRQAHPGPLVLLGHSMGGLVVARYVAEGLSATPAAWYRPVDALVMSSPALAIPMNGFQKGLLAVLGSLAPDLAVNNGLKPEWISRDAKVVAAYLADPLVHDRITPKLVRFMLEGGELARGQASQWRLPTLLMFAGADRCVAPWGSREFAANAPKSVVTSHEFGPLFHEIFNEPEQAEVLAALSSWLQALKLPAA